MRVLTYNLEFGGRKQLEAITTVLQQANADVVGLTEADDEGVVTTLAERLQVHHLWARGSGDRHIALLSRYPIGDWHIYNRSPLTQAVLQAKIDAPGGSFTVFTIHFLPYLLLPFELHRWRAVGALLRLIRQEEPGPHLILGDLNAIGSGDRVLQHLNPARMRRVMAWQLFIVFRLAIPRLCRAGYTDCFRRLHPREDGFTWHTGLRTTRYDYILADKVFAAALQSCRVVDDVEGVHLASDHYPVLAEFGWGGGGELVGTQGNSGNS